MTHHNYFSLFDATRTNKREKKKQNAKCVCFTLRAKAREREIEREKDETRISLRIHPIHFSKLTTLQNLSRVLCTYSTHWKHYPATFVCVYEIIPCSRVEVTWKPFRNCCCFRSRSMFFPHLISLQKDHHFLVVKTKSICRKGERKREKMKIISEEERCKRKKWKQLNNLKSLKICSIVFLLVLIKSSWFFRSATKNAQFLLI